MQTARVDARDDVGLNTRLGLSNFIEHLAPINTREIVKNPSAVFPERPQTPKYTVAYDIGDCFFNLGVETSQLFPGDGSILSSQITRQTDASPMALLSFQKVGCCAARVAPTHLILQDSTTVLIHLRESGGAFVSCGMTAQFVDGTSLAVTKATVDALLGKTAPPPTPVSEPPLVVPDALVPPPKGKDAKTPASKEAPKDKIARPTSKAGKEPAPSPAAESERPASRPASSHPPAGLDITVAAASGLTAQLLASGTVRQFYASRTACEHSCESHLLSPAMKESSRSVTPQGTVVRFLISGDAEALTPAGHRYRLGKDGEWSASLQSGERFSVKADGSDAARASAITAVLQTDVHTKARVTTNEELTVFVERGNDFIVQFSDGTRITTQYNPDKSIAAYRVECLGYAPVAIQGSEVSVHISSAVTVTNDAATKIFTTTSLNGPGLKLQTDGLVNILEDVGAEFQHSANFLTGAVHASERGGQVFSLWAVRDAIVVAPASAADKPTTPGKRTGSARSARLGSIAYTESMHPAVSDLLHSMHSAGRLASSTAPRTVSRDGSSTGGDVPVFTIAPRLFIVRADGSGMELCRNQDVEARISAEKAHAKQRAGCRLEQLAEALEHEAQSSSLLLYLTQAAEDMHKRSYAEDSVIPVGLRRAKSAPAKHLRGAAETVRFRHFVRHPHFAPEQRQQVIDDMMAYVEWKQEQVAKFNATAVTDMRSEETLAKAAETVREYVKLHAMAAMEPPGRVQAKVRLDLENRMTVSARSHSSARSSLKSNKPIEIKLPPKKSAAEVAEAQRLLRERDVPTYFHSEHGKEFLKTLDLQKLAAADPQPELANAKPRTPVPVGPAATAPVAPVATQVPDNAAAPEASVVTQSDGAAADEPDAKTEVPAAPVADSDSSSPPPAAASADPTVAAAVAHDDKPVLKPLRVPSRPSSGQVAVDAATLPAAPPRLATPLAPLPPIRTDKPEPAAPLNTSLKLSSATVDFGVLKAGCAYAATLKISNMGETVHFRVKYNLASALLVAPVSGAVCVHVHAASALSSLQIHRGIETKFELTFAPRAATTLSEPLTIMFDDGSVLTSTVVAKVLAASDFEALPPTSTMRGRSVRLVNVA